MTSTRTNLIAAIAVLGTAAVLFVLLSPGGSDEEPPAPADDPPAAAAGGREQGGQGGSKNPEPAPRPEPVPEVVIQGGQPVGGPLEIEVDEGDTVRFAVDSDVDEEIHVHGFDLHKDVSAGQRVEMAFDAEFTGIFEVELEQSAVPIAEIQVNP
jgi:hypothetical protein